MKTKLDQIIDNLKSNGMTQPKIEEYLININNMVAEQVYKTMMLELPEKDMKDLENLPEDQFDDALNQKYQAVSGKTPSQLTSEVFNKLVTSILEEIKP